MAALVVAPDGRQLPTLSGVEAVQASPGGALEADEGSIEDDFEARTAIDRTRAFVKIQDGCSFYCTYCIIPRARGPALSVAADAVLADVSRFQGEHDRFDDETIIVLKVR